MTKNTTQHYHADGRNCGRTHGCMCPRGVVRFSSGYNYLHRFFSFLVTEPPVEISSSVTPCNTHSPVFYSREAKIPVLLVGSPAHSNVNANSSGARKMSSRDKNEHGRAGAVHISGVASSASGGEILFRIN